MDSNTITLLGQVRFIEQDGKFKLLNREPHVKSNFAHVFENPSADHRLGAKLFPNFDRKKQNCKIYCNQILRLILTLSFLAGYYGSIIYCQKKQPVDHRQKRTFDAVSTGLILGLGLNFFEAFKDLAKVARWKILSNRYFKPQKVVLILGAESLMKVFRLMTLSSLKSPECLSSFFLAVCQPGCASTPRDTTIFCFIERWL